MESLVYKNSEGKPVTNSVLVARKTEELIKVQERIIEQLLEEKSLSDELIEIDESIIESLTFVLNEYRKFYSSSDDRFWEAMNSIEFNCTSRPKKTYLIYDKSANLYKIGRAISPDFRAKTIMQMNPSSELMCTCQTDIETELHKHFEEKRVNGEWFRLDDLDVEYVKHRFATTPGGFLSGSPTRPKC
jgi:hypothetical protein